MFLIPNQHMLLRAANIFVAAADLSVSGRLTQLAIKYSHIVSTPYLADGIQNKTTVLR